MSSRYNNRITILKRVAGEDTVGQESTALVEHRKAWADFRLLSGLQTIKADAGATVVKGSAQVRYCTDLAEGMVIEYLGRRYKIQAVLPDLKRRRHVDLAVEAVS